MSGVSVYFIECAGRIKIGCSKNIQGRLAHISTSAPAEVSLIASIPGDYRLEKAIHRHLATHRERGEWFTDCPAVREAIQALVSAGSSAIGFVEKTKASAPPSQLQAAISTLIKQSTPFGRTPASLLVEATGIGMRTARNRLANQSSYTPDELRALLMREDGFDFVKAIMADACPSWWAPMRGRSFPQAKGRR